LECKKNESDPPPVDVTSAATRTPSAVDPVPQRRLGSTGVSVSTIGLGGYHIGLLKDARECARLIHSAVERGVTFMDNSCDYHAGRSEEWMGAALAGGLRQKVFLMTKVDGRTKKAAAEQLDQSLRRLRVDMIDLVQIHEVIRETDPARCFAEGGAIEALVEAK